MFIYIGIISFIFFYIYDLNMVFFKTKPGNLCFMLASLLLFAASTGLIAVSFIADGVTSRALVGLFVALLFLVLLIYTLFFALPAKETYVDTLQNAYEAETERPVVCRDGMYALCRHPGVLWLFFFYLGIYAAYPTQQNMLAWLIFSAMDLIYIILQDLVIFPRQFRDYYDYKRTTPFLFPNGNSIRKAIQTTRRKR